MRFGRGNLRRGNLIVETLIFTYFSRLPRSMEVVTRCEKNPYFYILFEVTSLRRGGNL